MAQRLSQNQHEVLRFAALMGSYTVTPLGMRYNYEFTPAQALERKGLIKMDHQPSGDAVITLTEEGQKLWAKIGQEDTS